MFFLNFTIVILGVENNLDAEYFEGVWGGQLRCPQQKGDLHLSITSSCTRASRQYFKCIATEVFVVIGKLPHNLSEADAVKFSSENPSFYLVTGDKIEDLQNDHQSYYYDPYSKSFEFDNVNFTLFGPCSGRWEKGN